MSIIVETTESLTVIDTVDINFITELSGLQGPAGPAGQGVPTGGTAGQVLAKIDGTNYNTEWTDPLSGLGTVTDVSVTTANGISGTVATSTTTPAISLVLGDITPNSVAAVGTVTGSNISGSTSGINTGDQDLSGYALTSSLATVATSGSYNDLADLPTIPTLTSELTNDSGFITGNQSITVSGDVTGTGTTSIVTTLATVNADVGTFGSTTLVPVITTNAKGQITAVSTAAIAPGGVTSFNTRTGAVTLTSGDVTGALTYTPYDATNPAGYTTNTGTVTSVGTGTGLTGGPITTTGTISLNAGSIASLALADSATQPGDNISTLTNDSGFTTNTGTVTSVGVSSTGTITVGSSPVTTSGTITVDLANTAVTPGAYTYADITVDAQGRITAAANGTPPVTTPAGSNTEIQFNNAGAFGASSNLTWNGSALGVTGDVLFSGSARRISGDMTTSTANNRVAFQSSTANGQTAMMVVPNGTSQAASLNLENNSTVGVNAFFAFAISGTEATVGTGQRGGGTALPLTFKVGSSFTQRLQIDVNGNIYPGTAALSTSATDGFVYSQGCAGIPTGVPTTVAGRVPVVVDTTNNKLYFYSSGSWQTPAAGLAAPNYEAALATAAQTVFNTTLTTTANAAGKAYLQVFVNGVKQQEGAGKHYTVTGATQITFNTGLTLNDDVEFYGFV